MYFYGNIMEFFAVYGWLDVSFYTMPACFTPRAKLRILRNTRVFLSTFSSHALTPSGKTSVMVMEKNITRDFFSLLNDMAIFFVNIVRVQCLKATEWIYFPTVLLSTNTYSRQKQTMHNILKNYTIVMFTFYVHHGNKRYFKHNFS